MSDKDLSSLKRDLDALKISITIIQTQFDDWTRVSKDWRTQICDKFELMRQQSELLNGTLINLRLDLPCKERKSWYEGVNRQLKFMWVCTGGLIVAIVKDWLQRK